MEIDFSNPVKALSDINDITAQKRVAFQQHVLLLSSTLLGILVALHSKNSGCLYTRVVFAASLVAMSLGLLCIAFSLYAPVAVGKNQAKAFRDQALSAIRQNREIPPVFASEPPVFATAALAGYILLAIAILLLATYSVMLSFSS